MKEFGEGEHYVHYPRGREREHGVGERGGGGGQGYR